MQIKRFLTILRDLFLPQRRNACPHCGGVRCIGACQFDPETPRTGAGQSGEMREQPDGVVVKKKG